MPGSGRRPSREQGPHGIKKDGVVAGGRGHHDKAIDIGQVLRGALQISLSGIAIGI